MTRIHGRPSCLNKQEIVVIGGGPAGLSAAIWCAKLGLQVKLIECAKFPRDRPGESLHPGVEPLFDKLGVSKDIRSANFLRYAYTHIQWDNKYYPKFMPFGKDENGLWFGYQVLRADLDAIL